MYQPSRAILMRALDRAGHPLSDKNWHLNLIGIRATDGAGLSQRDTYDDLLVAIWHQDGRASMVYLPMTTDPGITWRRCPLNPKGTDILKEGHYPGLWRIGRHRGISPALVQRGPCTVYRDNNRDDRLDTPCGSEDTGHFGINLHSTGSISRYVGRASAGCQVLARPKDLRLVLALAAKHAAARTPAIDYTLITQDELAWIR